MSRIGKKPIIIPSGVEIKIENQLVSVKGRGGELKRVMPEVLEAVQSDGWLAVKPKSGISLDKNTLSLWGLNWALLSNMIKGVSDGFKKELEFSGVGFKAQLKGADLELSLGYTNPVIVKGPDGIEFKVEKNTIMVSGIDKELVGRIAAEIKSARLPEPYKGTGIKYKGEIIRRKAGKKAVATG